MYILIVYFVLLGMNKCFNTFVFKETIMKCNTCDNKLSGNKTKFCSNKCKQKHHYINNNTYFNQTVKYSTRKLEFINILGGKCKKCGYNKNVAALDFHHIEEGEKKFPLDSRNLSNRNISVLLQELKKCELLCANCHREHHNPEHDMTVFTNFIKENVFKPRIKLAGLKKCKFCEGEFKHSTGQIFCSSICHEKSKMYPSRETILAALLIYKTKTKVSSMLGVSTKVMRRILNS